jgi:hypothetical protein
MSKEASKAAPKAGEVKLGIPDPERLRLAMETYGRVVSYEVPAWRRFELKPKDRMRRLD